MNNDVSPSPAGAGARAGGEQQGGAGRPQRRRGGPRRSRGRPVNGILVLDKPVGMGSNEVLQQVKRLYDARKAGHTGSLDRLASGLLPLCFGEATKLSAFLLNADKHYEAVVQLGSRTSTGDAEGEVIEQLPVPALDDALIEEALAKFRGAIEQIPPMHSAIKKGGKRLYELAHQGISIEREARPVTIHALELRDRGDDWFGIRVSCSKGTYIRTLGEDLAHALGTVAFVRDLRRTGAGPFRAEDMHTLADIEARGAGETAGGLDALLVPLDAALGGYPRIDLDDSLLHFVIEGQPVLVPRAPTSGLVRLYGTGAEFLGVGEVLDDGRIGPRRLLAGGR